MSQSQALALTGAAAQRMAMDAPNLPQSGRIGKKILKMTQVQIRCMLGRGGETIQRIIRETGGQIQIMPASQADHGDVMIVGRLEEIESALQEVLIARGCPLPLTSPQGNLVLDAPGIVQVPLNLIGTLVGPRGIYLDEVKARVRGPVIIQLLPHITEDRCQCLQIAGEKWLEAKTMILEKLYQLQRRSTTAQGRESAASNTAA